MQSSNVYEQPQSHHLQSLEPTFEDETLEVSIKQT